MSLKTGKESPDATLSNCTACGGCLTVCPSFLATGDEARSARGRATMLKALAAGQLGQTRGLDRRLSTCLDCGACASYCPAGVDLPGTIQSVRRAMTGRQGRERIMQLATRSLFHVAGAAASSRRIPEISPSWRQPEARVIFFPGCAANLMNPESGLAAVRVMNAAGADVITPRGLNCCGQPLESLGDADAAAAMLRSNLQAMTGIDADAIVTICATCAIRLRDGLPRLSGVERGPAARLAAKVIDIHQWLAKRSLPQLKDDAGTLTVTWHDPCHMRWQLGLYDEPRMIIKALPGVEYVESSRPGACCGGGGLFRYVHRDLALSIGRSRAGDISATGAEVVATGCPSCQAQLKTVLAGAGATARVMHTVELIAAALPAHAPVSAGMSRMHRK